MITSGLLRRSLRPLNALVLAAAWTATFVTIGPLSTPRLMLLGGGAIVVVVATAAAALPAAWRRALVARDRIVPAAVRLAVAIAPTVAMIAVIWSRSLWWTQRPFALRVFGAWIVLDWFLTWSLPAEPVDLTGRVRHVRSSVIGLAALLALLALEGIGFGLTPFGCGLSAVVAVVAVSAAMLGFSASHEARVNLLTAWVATLVTFGALEAVVRLTHFGANLRESDSREYAREFYTLTPPGSAFIQQPTPLDEFPPALIEINSLGMRGPEIPDGRADVLLLGDSFVEARQLSFEQIIGPRLQAVFESRGAGVRVAGQGVRGWSPLLEWNWYLKVGRSLKPRTVMLFFFWNDLWPEGTEEATFRAVLRPDGRPDHFDVLVEPNWIWYHHVRTLRIVEAATRAFGLANLRRGFASIASKPAASDMSSDAGAAAAARSAADGPPLTAAELDALLTVPDAGLSSDLRAVARGRFWPGMRPLELWTDAQRTAAATTERELQRFAEDVRADGGRLTIVYVPNPLQIGARECTVGRFFDRVDGGVVLPPDSGVQAWLRDVTGRHAIPFFDLTTPMRAADATSDADATRAADPTREAAARDGQPPLYLRADCHWSAAGHQFVADHLADWYTGLAAGGTTTP